jgi:hypothetical protein
LLSGFGDRHTDRLEPLDHAQAHRGALAPGAKKQNQCFNWCVTQVLFDWCVTQSSNSRFSRKIKVFEMCCNN